MKVTPDLDVLLTEITRTKRLAAAMVDAAAREPIELMIGTAPTGSVCRGRT